MIVVTTSARYAERGTVRAGIFTSPLGINATSIPTKAKINRITASPNDLLPGQALQLRFGGWIKNSPAQMNNKSGKSFATVITVTAPAPSRTPRMLINTSEPYTASMTTIRISGPPRTGTTSATEFAKTFTTPATAPSAVRKYKIPARNPTYRPNATST